MRPAADTRVWGDFLVRLRVTDPTRSEEAIAGNRHEAEYPTAEAQNVD